MIFIQENAFENVVWKMVAICFALNVQISQVRPYCNVHTFNEVQTFFQPTTPINYKPITAITQTIMIKAFKSNVWQYPGA